MVFGLLFSGVLSDFKTDKIPNSLVVSLLIIKIINLFYITHIDYQNSIGFTCKSFLLSILIILFLYPFFMIGTLGAGDIKLIFVLLIGNRNPLYFLLSVFVLGLIIGVLNNVRRGTFLNRIRIIKEKIRSALLTGNPSELVSYLNDPEHKKEKGVIVHLSLPILITETLRIIIDLFKGV